MMTTIILMLILFTECFGCLANETNELSVSQTPAEIRVSTGMPAEITCSWKNNDSVKRFRVTWKIQNLTCKEGTSKDLFSKLYYTANCTHKNKTVLRIDIVKGNYTGIYFCEITIEIPFMKKGMGNGTTLIVEEKGLFAEAGSTEKYNFMAILAIFPCLASVACFYFCYKKQQNSENSDHYSTSSHGKKCETSSSGRSSSPSQTTDVTPEMWNEQNNGDMSHKSVPLPSVSERRTHEEQTLRVMELDEGNEINEADERNSSSSNSSEWVTSTLYESLDYFAMKQTEDKEEDNKHSVAFSSNAAD